MNGKFVVDGCVKKYAVATIDIATKWVLDYIYEIRYLTQIYSKSILENDVEVQNRKEQMVRFFKITHMAEHK